MRVYRITVAASNSRKLFPSAYFVYDVRATDTVQASRLIPLTHKGPKDVLYANSMAPSGQSHAYYPEWTVERMELRRGQKRRPVVWLGKSSVTLVDRGLVTEYL